MKSRQGLQGFSLVELMVTVTMLGILLAVAAPSFNAMVGDNRISAESNKLIANLSYSRTAASARASVITMERKSTTAKDWSQGWEIYTDLDANGNTARIGADILLRDIEPLDAGITINTSTSGNRWISFRSNGMLNEAGNTVVIAICDDRGEASGRDLNIGISGRVRVTTPSLDCTP